MGLTVKQVESLIRKEVPGAYADTGGLYLKITPAGSASWQYRYQLNGRRRMMGLGSCFDVTLGEARERAGEARKQAKRGIDPIDARDDGSRARMVAEAKRKTFKECAEACIADKRAEWRNEKHAAQWAATLKTYAYPFIGHLPAHAIDTVLVRKCLDPIWTEKTETATRLRQRIERVLDWAKVHGLRSGDNPAAWKGHLEGVLPNPSSIRPERPQPSLPYTRINEFVRELRTYDDKSAIAIEFMIMTALRSGSVIKAQWDQIDFDKAMWTIPAANMKGRKNKTDEMRVALSSRAIELLKKMEGKDPVYVFPGDRKAPHITDGAMGAFIKGMNEKREKEGLPLWVDPKQDGRWIVPHGFRSTFRTWSEEVATNHSRAAKEFALGHKLDNKVEAAYQRSDLFEMRLPLMEAWAAYCDTKPADNVIGIKKRKTAA